jgi:molecular chaperone GrpE
MKLGGTPGDESLAGDQPQTIAGESSLAEQVQKLLAEKEDLQKTLVRRQADFENYRKRVEQERRSDRNRGIESLIEHILPVLDAFDRALGPDHDASDPEFRKGFELIHRQIWDVLVKQGLKRIESTGKQFDPNFHHAIDRAETTEHPDGTVISEFQPGYTFHGRVLRPAMVRVAATPEPKAARASKLEN